MIKFTGTFDGKPSVGIGLSHKNLDKLKAGEYIHIHLAELNLPYDLTIFIFAGTTEEQMHKDFLEAGAIGPDTVTHLFEEPQ